MPFRLNAVTGRLDVVNDVDGFVDGPAISTDNAIARFNGTTGKLLESSGSTISDSNVLTTGELLLTTDLSVTEGGTGISSAVAYAVICGGTVASGAFQSVATVGAIGTVLTSNGPGVLPSFQAGGSGSGDVTAAANLTDNALIRGDGGAKGVQDSGILIDDSDVMTGVTQLGIGTSSPVDTLHVVGNIDLVHVASESDDHAIEIDCDANSFGDVKAVDINYITGAITSVQDEECILLNIDESASIGGIVNGYEVLSTAEGSATINGYTTGINVNPIVHQSGVFSDPDTILNKAVDVTAALSSGGAGAISIFVDDSDTLTIGDAAMWDEHEIILATGASGSGVAPLFEYSTGGAAYSPFSPADGTNGFRNTGVILWDSSQLTGWATATSGEFEVRITRTRNNLNTTPIIDELQISATTEYTWLKDGAVKIKNIAATDNTAYAVLCGGTTSNDPFQSVASLGSSGQALVSNGAAALPSFQSLGPSMSWTDVTGTSQAMAVNSGYFANNAGLVTLTLPVTAAQGSIIKVAGVGAGGWAIAQNAGQLIKMSTLTTTPGVGGSLASTELTDSLELICYTTDSAWMVVSVMGNITTV